MYLCFGALSLTEGIPGRPPLAEDACGTPIRWFSSGCPNSTTLRSYHLKRALERLSDTHSARGLFVDGARFASFASAEGSAAFYTCFCPECAARMQAVGLDPKTLRTAVLQLSRGQRVEKHADALADWLRFRAWCVRTYFDDFAKAVHALPGNKKAGAFVFAPSLCGFVGQTPESFRSLDMVSPMLYRAYPHPEWPACLGHEWAYAKRLLGENALQALTEIAAQISGLPAFFPTEMPEALLSRGFSPAHVAREIELLRERIRPGQQLLPILQIEDTCLQQTVSLGLTAGAEGVGLFAYGQADIE